MRAVVVALGLGLGLAAATTLGSACRIPNEEHCANQDVPGNQFCRERNAGAPFCSPCERRLRGCVQFEPFACAGYDPDPGEEDEPAPMTGSSTGDLATSTTGDLATGSGSSAGDSGTTAQ